MRRFLRLLKPGSRLYFAVLVIFAACALLSGAYDLALGFAVTDAVLLCYAALMRLRLRKNVTGLAESVLYGADDAGRGALTALPMPVLAFALADGEIHWANGAFMDLIGEREHFFDLSLSDLLPGFDYRWLVGGKSESPELYAIHGREYRVRGSALRSDSEIGSGWGLLYWEDVTDYTTLRREYEASHLTAMVIMLDNYDELFKGLTDTIKSPLQASIDTKINEWTRGADGFLTRIDKDRYAFFFEARWLAEYTESKFPLLDSVRGIRSPSGVSATVSIGVGKDAATPAEAFQFATLAIEMALSRGGDQAVVKNKLDFTFYGGQSQAVERNTKVKARVMANTLGELISDSSGILIMGHKYADFDCIGAAAGLTALARKRSRRARVVINGDTNLAMAVVRRLKALPEYEGVFVTPQDAMLVSDSRTLLIIVDTNRPEQVESDSLLQSCTRIAVIDHHRRAADYIANAAFSYHEPFASSASELVTDILEYLAEPRDLHKSEADAMLAGLVLDTKSFSQRTGSKTFEAAVFLRRAGADTTEVKKLFQIGAEQMSGRARIIVNAKVYRDSFAVAVDSSADRVVAAQAADELLDISGIKAAFVITGKDGSVSISARSNSDVNVQLLMEQLGGGGTATMAGAQIKGKTRDEVEKVLIDTLKLE